MDLRVVFEAPISKQTLAPLRERVRDRFPNIDERHQFEAHLRAEAGRVAAAETRDLGFHGLFFKAPGDAAIAQFRTDGFTFSRLRGYTSADEMFDEALPLWSEYALATNPRAVVRIALRYINRLELAFRDGDPFERFLNAAPTMPAGTPQRVSSFLTRVVSHDEAGDAIVTQKLEHSVERADLILDIDVFRIGQFGIEVAGLRPVFASLRELKNRLFFAFLTDTALERYDV